MGEIKELPGLPVGKFRGGFVPGLMYMSSKESIISDILTEALKYLDQLNVFEWRQDVPNPFVLLNGHGSRLQLPFLEYINSPTSDEKSKCMFTIGTTNGVDVWQVGDICHQNGCWKMDTSI